MRRIQCAICRTRKALLLQISLRVSRRTLRGAAAATVVLIAVVVAPQTKAFAQGSSQDGWTQFQGGPGHPGALEDGPAPPYRLAWRFRAPGDFSAPVIDGNVVITVGTHAVYGVDLATGQVRWTLVRNGGPVASPAVARAGRKLVLVFTDRSSQGPSLVAVDLHNLRELWRTSLQETSSSGVTVDGSSAFVGDDGGNLYAIDLSSGQLRWTAHASGRIDAPPAAAGGMVFAVSRDASTSAGLVLAAREVDGSTGWEYTPRVVGAVSSPAAGDGLVVLGFADQVIRAFGDSNGEERWGGLALSIFSPFTSPALAGGDVYIADLSAGIYRLNAESGERVWDYQFSDIVVRGSPVVSGTSVVLGLDDGRLIAIDSKSGNLVWQGNPSPGWLGAIAVSSDKLVLVKGGSGSGLLAFEHDPRGLLVDVPPPTELDLVKLIRNFTTAFVIAIAVLYVPFRVLARRSEEVASEDGAVAGATGPDDSEEN